MIKPLQNREVQALILIAIAFYILLFPWTWRILIPIEPIGSVLLVMCYINEARTRMNSNRRMKKGWIVIGNEVI